MRRLSWETNLSWDSLRHIPEKNEHVIRYYGWYSHRRRGMRAKLEQATPADDQVPTDRTALGVEKSVGGRPAAGSPSTWAMLIKRIYEVDPLECGKCGSEMKIISFIGRDQRPVIERILRGHQSGAMVGGLWAGPIRTLAK